MPSQISHLHMGFLLFAAKRISGCPGLSQGGHCWNARPRTIT